MSIKNWPKNYRPREKLLLQGENSLSDIELLAILLQNGTKEKNVMQIAEHILHEFGDLNHLLSASIKTLSKSPGIGPAKSCLLKASLEITRRYFFEKTKRESVLKSKHAIKQFLITKLGRREQEIFACLFLNNQYHVTAYEELFFGGIDRADIHPREIIKAALKHNATAIICAHNHTSGDTQPSLADLEVAKQLQTTLKWLDINLLDHFIVGHLEAISLQEKQI